MVRILAVVALAGCGRHGFEPGVADADHGDAPPIEHDEDGDGIGDSIDVCPGIADPAQIDLDADGVGDACDRSPTEPRQTIALFMPLVGDDPRCSTTGTWTQTADAWAFDGNGFGSIDCAMAFGDGDIWTGIDVTAIPPASARQIAMHLDQQLDPHYYAEVYEVIPTEDSFKLTEYTGGSYVPVAIQPLAGLIHTGALTLHLQARLAPRQLAFEGGWPGERYEVTGAAPGYIGGNAFDVAAVDVGVEVRYIMVIATAP